ncbi:MAG: hypothetical protein JWN40_3109 [Phycisphaerales bacterium]|nr:hypothetical protein [Phycisphaerales bacterium]
MKVRGIEHMTLGELVDQVKHGGRFVVFHWCVGLLVKTAQRPSAIRFVRPGERAGRGLLQTLGTLLTGWWAVPFGPSATIGCLKENLRGGRDITATVLRGLVRAEHMAIQNQHPSKSPATSHAA